MKYFVNSTELIASKHKNYTEFQLPNSEKKFWDDESVYMHEDTLNSTGFNAFWEDCMYDFIVFDMDTISKEELSKMIVKANKYDKVILEILNELKIWIDGHNLNTDKPIAVFREYDREDERRRIECQNYPVDPEFYEELNKIDKKFSIDDEVYLDLLRKYNMPVYYFYFI